MKRFLLLMVAVAFMAPSFAASKLPVASKASEIFLPIGNNTTISLEDLSAISVKDYQLISGKKMNFFEKIYFKAGQKKLRNSINADGTINNKRLVKMMNADNSVGFHLGGFALGFFVGLIGVLIAYVIKGDEAVDRNRRKWAWIGFGAWVVILLIALAAA